MLLRAKRGVEKNACTPLQATDKRKREREKLKNRVFSYSVKRVVGNVTEPNPGNMFAVVSKFLYDKSLLQ